MGSKLSAAQIAGFASQAGFTGDDLPTAIAIALAESNGDPSAVGDRSLAPLKGPSVGLWQIDIGQQEHPEVTEEQMLDPAQNAAKAFEIWQIQGFNAWTTYKSGAYTAYLNFAVQAVSA